MTLKLTSLLEAKKLEIPMVKGGLYYTNPAKGLNTVHSLYLVGWNDSEVKYMKYPYYKTEAMRRERFEDGVRWAIDNANKSSILRDTHALVDRGINFGKDIQNGKVTKVKLADIQGWEVTFIYPFSEHKTLEKLTYSRFGRQSGPYQKDESYREVEAAVTKPFLEKLKTGLPGMKVLKLEKAK
jgi:hypothetical protein